MCTHNEFPFNLQYKVYKCKLNKKCCVIYLEKMLVNKVYSTIQFFKRLFFRMKWKNKNDYALLIKTDVNLLFCQGHLNNFSASNSNQNCYNECNLLCVDVNNFFRQRQYLRTKINLFILSAPSCRDMHLQHRKRGGGRVRSPYPHNHV